MMRVNSGLLVILFTACSCSRYQYIGLSSDNVPKHETNQFVMENDSLRVTYKFAGENGPVQMAIVNKSKTALLVDWNRSFLVKGRKSVPLFTPKEKVKAKKEKLDFMLDEVIIREQALELVPVYNSLNKESVDLFRRGFLRGRRYKTEKVMINGSSRKIRKTSFGRERSPRTFGFDLTLLPGENRGTVTLDHSFYISELWRSRVPPDKLPAKGDMAFMKEPTIATIATAPVWLPPLILISAWLAMYESKED